MCSIDHPEDEPYYYYLYLDDVYQHTDYSKVPKEELDIIINEDDRTITVSELLMALMLSAFW